MLKYRPTDTVESMSGSVGQVLVRKVQPVVADLAEVAMDAVYLSVGAGVLTYQKAQVRRRELQDRLEKLGSQVVSR